MAEPTIGEGLITGAICLGICIAFDAFGCMIIKHPWSLTFKQFYAEYQQWITLIYIAIFVGPILGYLSTLIKFYLPPVYQTRCYAYGILAFLFQNCNLQPW